MDARSTPHLFKRSIRLPDPCHHRPVEKRNTRTNEETFLIAAATTLDTCFGARNRVGDLSPR
jgi:hypothetical protein